MSMSDLERFYDLLGLLESQPLQGQTLAECTGKSPWPRRGVYFFREPGEHRGDKPKAKRIVRVGTHAVGAGAKSTLWSRLRAHRGTLGGGGNHRGSIFRLHVGAALLERDRETLGMLPTWAQGSSASKEIRVDEAAHERRVSAHLGAMTLLWVDVSDEPGPASMRVFIERNAIALLSNRRGPHDEPSEGWLGLHSVRPEIRSSGLWNLNHIDEEYDPRFLDVLAACIKQQIHT